MLSLFWDRGIIWIGAETLFGCQSGQFGVSFARNVILNTEISSSIMFTGLLHYFAHTHKDTHVENSTGTERYTQEQSKNCHFQVLLQLFFKCWLEVNHIHKLLFSSLYVLMSEGCLKCQKHSRTQRIQHSKVVSEDMDLKECCREGKSY